MPSDFKDLIGSVRQRIDHLLARLDVPAQEAELARLEQRSAQPDFWNDSDRARGEMRRIADLRETTKLWRTLEKDAASTAELHELAVAEGDRAMQDQLAAEANKLAARLDGLEIELAFTGKYDSRNAILSVHAGAGGTESQDWAQMLMRMYLRWAERRGFEADVLDLSQGEQAGIKSVQIEVRGKHAYGYLRSEKGVHRLVRLSPYDANHLRHTSFALVEVMPEAEENIDIVINPDDLRFDFFRASGHGGQNVQKNSTAVRVVHIPTGHTVAVQNERSQRQNRDAAMKILMSKLMQDEIERRAEEHDRIKGEHVSAEWGNRIRSYVLHPYKQVKDHRTDHESTDPNGVLDGDLDPFITAYLRESLGKDKPA
ncbi:MAG: peptide chain release factor 2 [Chloroflexi bacterium]|nr:peptide chain release factor 2 [Chloroflexota bacterium]